MRTEKWVIQRVRVNAGEVAGIDFRLPANVSTCTGIAFTVTDIDGDFSQLLPMGEVHLSFNNKATCPLNYYTEHQDTGYRMVSILLRLEEPLLGGSRVTGYYRCLTNPHLLRIYLQCIAKAD
jgi:hypothetical protein